MKKPWKVLNERGIVSLIAVSLAAILLMIVATSIVLIVTNEARQATEADLGSRAYYAAQAGMEEGIYKLKQALKDPTNPTAAVQAIEKQCLAHTSFGTDLDYSCLYLSHQNSTLEGPLYKDSTPVQIDLSGVNMAKVEISWNNSNDGQLTDLASLPGAFATGADWHSNPAVLEVSTVRFKPDGSGLFNPTDPTQLEIVKNVFVPSNAPVSVLSDYTLPARRTAPYFVNCSAQITPSNPYNCKQTIDYTADGAGYKHILAIGARFNGTHYSIRVLDSNNAYITNVPNQYETIDVTAKAGSVFRRVRSKVAIYKGTAALDYAIFSDEDICKDFRLRDIKSGNDADDPYPANIGSCPF